MMNLNDLTADMISKINMSMKTFQSEVKVFRNRKNLLILKFLLKLGLIKNISINNKNIIIYLQYLEGRSTFTKIKLLATTKQKHYITNKKLKRVLSRNTRTYVLSTKCGLMTDNAARLSGLGGLLLLKIYH